MAKGLSSLSDAELLGVANQTVTAMTPIPGEYGAVAADIAALQDQIVIVESAVADQSAKIADGRAATSVKEAEVTTLIDMLGKRRDVARAHGASEAQMRATTIPVASAPVPSIATEPMLSVDTSKRLQHILSWFEATTPDNKKRPRGTMGAEIWRKIDGPPPTDVSECTFVALDSAVPHIVGYTGEEAGKMVHYMGRWKMRDGGTLAFGETVSATVTG